jgi:hypothetical protein
MIHGRFSHCLAKREEETMRTSTVWELDYIIQGDIPLTYLISEPAMYASRPPNKTY